MDLKKRTNRTIVSIMLLTMVCVQACTHDDDNLLTDDNLIRLDVTSVEGLQGSRALIGEGENEISLQSACSYAEAIAVWGDYTTGNTNNEVFSDTPLTYGNQMWSYTGGYRFWQGNSLYKFRAYYPKNTLGSNATATDASSVSIAYNTEALQEDLLVAYKEVDPDTIMSKAVQLQMHHALSAIRFQFQTIDGTAMKLQSFALCNETNGSGLSTSGTLSFDGQSVVVGDWDSESSLTGDFYEWQHPANGSSFNQTDEAIAYQPADNTKYTENKGYVLIIPQEYNGGTKLKFTIDGQVYSTALPKITFLPGYRYTYSIKVKGGEPVSLLCIVKSWDLVETTNEFSNTVVVKDEGKIKWTDGTYQINPDDPSQIILKDDIESPAEFTFKISNPLGGTWHAIVSTITGATDAFEICDTNGNVKTEGAVGKEVTLRIRAKRINTTNVSNMAELMFVVRNGGLTLPVDIITTLGNGQNYTIVQNINK